MNVKESMKNERLKTYMTVSRENFPIRYIFEGKEYEVRYTMKGGLIMTGVKKNDDISHT